MMYGYARVSTTDQDLSIQEAALRAAGCETIRSEKVTGTTREGRTELATLIEFMRKGDVLVVTRIDRLARSIGDLQDIVKSLKEPGCCASGHGTADRHRNGRRQSISRHAGGVRRIRDEPSEGAPARRDRSCEEGRRLQRQTPEDRHRHGEAAAGRGPWRDRDCGTDGNRSGVCLSRDGLNKKGRLVHSESLPLVMTRYGPALSVGVNVPGYG